MSAGAAPLQAAACMCIVKLAVLAQFVTDCAHLGACLLVSRTPGSSVQMHCQTCSVGPVYSQRVRLLVHTEVSAYVLPQPCLRLKHCPTSLLCKHVKRAVQCCHSCNMWQQLLSPGCKASTLTHNASHSTIGNYRNSRCHANSIVTTVLTLLPPHLAVLHSAGFAHSHLHCWQAYSRYTSCAATSTAWLKSLEVTEASHLEYRARHSARSKTQQG